MIRAEQIPPEVVEAAARADYEAFRDWADIRDQTLDWEYLEGEEREGKRIFARASIAAALAAWPDAEARPTFGPSRIILPLPQEVSDE